jgi:hypothetical protein
MDALIFDAGGSSSAPVVPARLIGPTHRVSLKTGPALTRKLHGGSWLRAMTSRAARFRGEGLNAWRRRRGLYVRELAWIHGIAVSTLEDKLADRYPPRLDTERIVDLVDLALARGYAPPGWPHRLSRQIHVNNLDYDTAKITQHSEFRPSASGEKP